MLETYEQRAVAPGPQRKEVHVRGIAPLSKRSTDIQKKEIVAETFVNLQFWISCLTIISREFGFEKSTNGRKASALPSGRCVRAEAPIRSNSTSRRAAPIIHCETVYSFLK